MSTTAEVRRAYLDYFARHGHTVVPSSSLVPAGDATLLFTNAGMVQFKDAFLGLERKDYKRATTAQKCMRVSGKHNDLENVGQSPQHHTFFEMLGNFSFGDYFKREAISYAWEFLTVVLGIPKERLWATVYEEDGESPGLWQEIARLPPDRVVRLGKKTNFWMMGETGPCGPNSEVIYDRGAQHCTCGVPHCSPAFDNGCDRWWELWNLVFMQFDMAENGTVTPLPSPGVDTGMGLERMAALLGDASSTYDTDVFAPIIARTQALLGHSAEQVRQRIVGYRIVADHSRAMAFLVGDGVRPGNEGRGYVLRLIIRRAARHGKLLGFAEPFLSQTADTVIDVMGSHYTELQSRRAFILKIIQQEEERFQQTLSTGLSLLEEIIGRLREDGLTSVPGHEAFRLYDTYGFPLDLTREVAREQGFSVDSEGFAREMDGQRKRARAAHQFGGEGKEGSASPYVKVLEDLHKAGDLPPKGAEKLCYEGTGTETKVVAILRDGEPVREVAEGDEVGIVLPASPFYVESGGQVADTGLIAGFESDAEEPQWEFQVNEAREPVPGLLVHLGKVVRGSPRVGDDVWAAVDYERRWDIARNHTATHLLHSELRYVLGEHVQQAGSLMTPDRLRFDFTHSAMLTQDELNAVEQSVNDAILANYPVAAEDKRYREAVKEGAIALFGEKYAERVRVVKIGEVEEPFSQELCGGTHVDWTGEIGQFYILSESSVGAGVRRVEAVTGRAAYLTVRERMRRLEAAAAFLGCAPDEVDRKVLDQMEDVRRLEKELSDFRRQVAHQQFTDLLSSARELQGVTVLGAQVQAVDVDTLREMTDWFRASVKSGVVLLGAIIADKPSLIAAVTPDLAERGFDAVSLVRFAAREIGGGGGGRPTLAQAGGRRPEGLSAAVSKAFDWVKGALAQS